ncbi:hypothetical protein V1291_005012 [Nitrobacteraceae bacterium AZCC 1564]
MGTRILGITVSALILAYGVVGATAQERMTPQTGQQQMQSEQEEDEEGGSTTGQGGGMMERGAMERGMRAHMMRHGMMGGGPPFMMRMMFALMDADGDGTISLQEFQAAHERIFRAMDTNKDGKLTPEEMRAFIRGSR